MKNKTQSCISLLLFYLSFIFLTSCNQTTNSSNSQTEESDAEMLLEKINTAGRINVGFEPDAPPLYFEESGTKKGFDFELISFLSEEVFDGVKINAIEDGYDQLPNYLQEGQIDILAGGRTDEENEDELYSDSYLSFGYCLLTTTGLSNKFNDLSSLRNARIGVYDDYTAQWIKEKVPTSNISIIGDREDENTPTSDWMSGLVKGEFDAIIYDYPFGANEIVDYNSKIVITNKNLNGEELSNYVLVLNKRTPGAGDLIIKINDAIQKFKRTEKYSDAIAEYIPNSNPKNNTNIGTTDTYTIQKGETLSIIARDKMGDVNRWSEIYNLNKDILASPDIIYSGQVIRKPAGWR